MNESDFNGTIEEWTSSMIQFRLVTTIPLGNPSTAMPNYTVQNNPYDLHYGIPVTIAMIIGYTSIFLIGVLGNLLVILSVWRNQQLRTQINFFLANLAVADLLVNVICVPFTLVATIFPEYAAWTLGRFCCKLVAYFQGVSVCASVNTLMAISIERCRTISNPLAAVVTTRQYRCWVLIVWLFALFINLPWLYVFTLEEMGNGSSLQICVELWSSETSENAYFIGANLILCYLGPLLVISICYLIIWYRVYYRLVPGTQNQHHARVVKNRNRATIMILVVVVTFAGMWLPLYIIFCTIKLTSAARPPIFDILVPIAQWLGASNSAINPILYSFMHARFRNLFSTYFCRCCRQTVSPSAVLIRQQTDSTRLSTQPSRIVSRNLVDLQRFPKSNSMF